MSGGAGGRGGRGLVEGSDIVVRQGGAVMDGMGAGMESLINNNSIIKSELEKKCIKKNNTI